MRTRILALILAVAALFVAFAPSAEAQNCDVCQVTSTQDAQGYPQREAACVSTSFDLGANWLQDCTPRADCTGCTGDSCGGTTYDMPGDSWPRGPLDTLDSCNSAGGIAIHVISAEYRSWAERCIIPWI